MTYISKKKICNWYFPVSLSMEIMVFPKTLRAPRPHFHLHVIMQKETGQDNFCEDSQTCRKFSNGANGAWHEQRRI